MALLPLTSRSVPGVGSGVASSRAGASRAERSIQLSVRDPAEEVDEEAINQAAAAVSGSVVGDGVLSRSPVVKSHNQ